jgi:hypothetical protein
MVIIENHIEKRKISQDYLFRNLKSKTRVVWNIFLKSKYLNLIKKILLFKKIIISFTRDWYANISTS